MRTMERTGRRRRWAMMVDRTAMKAVVGSDPSGLRARLRETDAIARPEKWALPAAGQNDVGGDRIPEGETAHPRDIDEDADDRKADYDEREYK